MKTCPYCAEEIKDAAIVCRYCGREVVPGAVAETSQSLETSEPNSLVDHYAKDEAKRTSSSEAAARPVVEPEIKKSLWPYTIVGGFMLAVLAALPRLGTLAEISQFQRGELLFRSALQDLAFHFVVNWILWSLGGALVIALWRTKGQTDTLKMIIMTTIIVILVVVAVFLLVGSGPSILSDFLGISSVQLLQPPSFSGSTSAPVVAATNTICGLRCSFETGMAKYWAPVTLTVEACEASPTCRMVTKTPGNLLGPAQTTVAATRSACEASPTCQMLPYYEVAASQTARAGE